MAFFTPSIQFFFGLPRALFCFGIHINAILGSLSSAILRTWPYHVSYLLLAFITEMKRVYCPVRTGSLNKAVCASSIKVSFIWEQTATYATYIINWLAFITEMKSVYSAVRTAGLNNAVCASSLKVSFLSTSKTSKRSQHGCKYAAHTTIHIDAKKKTHSVYSDTLNYATLFVQN